MKTRMQTFKQTIQLGLLICLTGFQAGATESVPAVTSVFPTNTCVVSGEKLGSMGESVTLVFGGKEVRFCCKPCRKVFQENPEPYLSPGSKKKPGLLAMPDRAIVTVQGLVCSFCAQGVQRNMCKLDFLDKDRFDQGLKTDIEEQGVALALDPGKQIDLSALRKAVERGGYELVRVSFFLRGRSSRQAESTILRLENGQTYRLLEIGPEEIASGQIVEVSGYVDADGFDWEKPPVDIPLNVTTIHE